MDQLSGSVMENSAEGFDQQSGADFWHFLIILRGSDAACRSPLYRCQSRKVRSTEILGGLGKANEYLDIKICYFMSDTYCI